RMALCADDLFLNQICDRRGLLPMDWGLRPQEARIRTRFPNACVCSTSTVLSHLVAAGTLSEERAGEITWQLFQHGYRGTSLRLAQSWLFRQYPYQSDALPIPYRRLLESLSNSRHWFPADDQNPRGTLFLKTMVTVLTEDLIAGTWTVPAGILPVSH